MMNAVNLQLINYNSIWCFSFKELLLNKAEREEEKKRKKREATAVVGDMKPLEDALPTLQWLIQNCSKTGNPAPV